MRLSTTRRILSDNLLKQGLRKHFYTASNNINRVCSLLRTDNHAFVNHLARDYVRFLLDLVKPIEGQANERARMAVNWLLLAHSTSADDGISYGYFPCDGGSGWRSAYPESTGYIITSLLEYARLHEEADLRQRALRMARWEAEIQMDSGAVQGGMVCSASEQTPSAFNTGMVLDGWTSAFRSSEDETFLLAARRAANFLIDDLGEDGYFRTNGRFVGPQRVKTYNVLCAWALYRHGQDVRDNLYQHVAVRITEAALRQQLPNGWFANNCLTCPEAPLLHTIGYALQGILEVGILAGRDDFINSVQKGVNPLIARLSAKGFIYGRYYNNWEPAGFSACLTGSAQLAVVCFRLHEHTGEHKYLEAASRILNYLKALQETDSADRAVNGAIGGSFPLAGEYMTAGYPNWATKYLLDALMLQYRLSEALD